MLTITPTSGSATVASSAIWPAPRIAISSTSTSVSSGAPRISSGRPISVLKFWREATVRRCEVSVASSKSLVVVFPVEPVTPMTFADRCLRQAVASRWSAASGSSAARIAPGGSTSETSAY